VLGGVNAETTETNADIISQVRSNTLADIVCLCVKVRKSNEPPVVELEGIIPGVEAALAVEVHGVVSCTWEFKAGNQAGVFIILVGPVMCVVG